MHRIVLGLLMMSSVFAAGRAWADDGACAANTLRRVSVDGQIQPVAVATDFDLATIGAMATKSGISLARPPEGFYIGTFFYTLAVDPAEAPNDCGAPVAIHLQLHLAKRVIEIGRELETRPCRRDAELEHYRRHAKADEAVIARYVVLIRDDLSSEPIGPGSVADWARSIVERDIVPLNDDRRAAQNATNTPDEFARIDEACTV